MRIKDDEEGYEVWAIRILYKDEEEMPILVLEYFICISLTLF